MRRGNYGTLALVAMLGGCGLFPPPLYVPPVPPPAVSSTFDGMYRATIVITQVAPMADRAWCESNHSVLLQVKDGHFSFSQPHAGYPGKPTETYQASIVTDGTVTGDSPAGSTISARATGTAINGTLYGMACTFSLNAIKATAG